MAALARLDAKTSGGKFAAQMAEKEALFAADPRLQSGSIVAGGSFKLEGQEQKAGNTRRSAAADGSGALIGDAALKELKAQPPGGRPKGGSAAARRRIFSSVSGSGRIR